MKAQIHGSSLKGATFIDGTPFNIATFVCGYMHYGGETVTLAVPGFRGNIVLRGIANSDVFTVVGERMARKFLVWLLTMADSPKGLQSISTYASANDSSTDLEAAVDMYIEINRDND